jgi:hypothetical protein
LWWSRGGCGGGSGGGGVVVEEVTRWLWRNEHDVTRVLRDRCTTEACTISSSAQSLSSISPPAMLHSTVHYATSAHWPRNSTRHTPGGPRPLALEFILQDKHGCEGFGETDCMQCMWATNEASQSVWGHMQPTPFWARASRRGQAEVKNTQRDAKLELHTAKRITLNQHGGYSSSSPLAARRSGPIARLSTKTDTFGCTHTTPLTTRSHWTRCTTRSRC